MVIFNQRFAWAVAILKVAPLPGGGVMQSGDIARNAGVARGRYLEPILQTLTGHLLLDGIRGPRGGYMLAVNPASISLADVEKAFRDAPGGHVRPPAPVPAMLQLLLDDWMANLQTINIAMLREPSA